MIKRISTLTIGLLLLLASVTGTTGINAMATSNSPFNKEQIKAVVERSIEDARRNAVYDSAGRVSKATIVLPELGRFSFEYKYDKQNRLQYILDEEGGLTRYEYNKSGELKSITLPNGVRMYELGKDGKGVFFKNRTRPVKRNVTQNQSVDDVRLTKVVMQDAGKCKAAVAAAVIAAAAAAAACGSGDAMGCVTQTTAAAVAAYAAYLACKSDAELMEGPQV